MSGATSAASEPGLVRLVDFSGVDVDASIEDLKARITARRFFWLDIAGVEPSRAGPYLEALGLDENERARALQFGQTGRISIGRQGIRAVTWVASTKRELIELHFRSTSAYVLTIWNGDPGVVDGAPRLFADRVGSIETDPYLAAAIVLQLLLGTIYRELGGVDELIDALSDQSRERPDQIKLVEVTRRRDMLRSVWLRIERYAAAVRSSTVGIEAIPGISDKAVAELDDYAERIEDVAGKLSERLQWATTVLQDYTVSLAQRQGEQIDRLAVVSIIFLPISFLTGFFGMNFTWMSDRLVGWPAFLALGLILPLVCALATTYWLRKRGVL